MTALLVDAAARGLIAPIRRRTTDPMARRLGLGQLRTVSLATLVHHAALMERSDRKYIGPPRRRPAGLGRARSAGRCATSCR